MKQHKNIFTIPAGVPFARTLAALLLEETKTRKEDLAQYRILLPTRRACRTLQEALLQQNDYKPMLLPRLQPMGDVDEEELSISLFAEGGLPAIPPAMGALERQIILSGYIQKLPGYAGSPARALALAAALSRLIDQIAIQRADISKLHELVPEEFAEHWQISLEFLKAITEYWPGVLADKGMIDGAERRNRLIDALSAAWAKNPPRTPVIAAGSTGSIPATAELLATIAAMNTGRVILPGLDQSLDQESWDALPESHPQYVLKQLLQTLNIDRAKDVQVIGDESKTSGRRFLSGEMMRPAATTERWRILTTSAAGKKQAGDGTKNLKIFTCDNERHEAGLVSLLLRESLTDQKRTAALVTPDRNLARRVASACRRWDIQVDDSSGQPLHQTPVGVYLRLCLDVGLNRLAPVPLLALLKHELSTVSLQNAPFRKTVDRLEVMTLRSIAPAPGFNGIRARLKDDSCNELLNRLETILSPMLEICNAGSPQKFMTLLEMHLRTAEALAHGATESEPGHLWRGEDGEAAAMLVNELRTQAALMPDMTPASYAEVFEQLMAGKNVRPAWGSHPRLMILGQMEARLIDADLIVLGGLNEGTWPPEVGIDPWMSRAMRKKFGLPGLEYRIGQSAHDFEQAFCAPNVVLTRAARVDGTPTIPSRWLQRLEAVLTACGIEPESLGRHPHISWATSLDQADSIKACAQPKPTPPAKIRPREISVTAVEQWLRDPYALYARYVLRLRRLDPPEKPIDAAEKGNFLHEVLKRFYKQYPVLPEDPAAAIMAIAGELKNTYADPAVWDGWWPRLQRIADFLAVHEREWRRTYTPAAAEAKGKIVFKTAGGDFTLSARADRIDSAGERGAVIDYKSGGEYSDSKLAKGQLPQLPLEAAILKSGVFEGVSALSPQDLSYWKLTGAQEPAEITQVSGESVEDLAKNTLENLKTLIEAFENDKIPYTALPRPGFLPRFNDYEHLERLREWSVAGGEEAA